MSRKTVVLLNTPEGRELVMASCEANGFGFAEFEELVKAQVSHAGDPNRYHMYAAFDDILDRIKAEKN
ncbi:hypothetical protein [Candidatus Spongiihabitans sp.]|uniref:hypothetical protein n=1 Tax=Candidatus Spongiihabitans sp. TaxID=3101308 RepID=UPI003C7C69C3